jgi:peptide/nickel transport system substrate-binding protein
MEFRGLPPSTRDELKSALGDKLTVQESEWNCGSLVTPNVRQKPFDDVRVRRALTLALDRWNGVPSLGKIANVRTVAGIVFPTSPLAATKEELQQLAGFWPDIEKSRAEARRLLKEAGAEGLSFELLNRNIDQPYKYVGTWLVDEWSKIGLKATQRMMPTGPWTDAMRRGEFQVVLQANCRGVPNPLLDVQPYLPASVFTANYGGYEDKPLVELYDRMLRETDFPKQRALMREFEKHVIDKEAHEIWVSWWYRIVPHRSYVKGWKISPSHFISQDLATVWLDR